MGRPESCNCHCDQVGIPLQRLIDYVGPQSPERGNENLQWALEDNWGWSVRVNYRLLPRIQNPITKEWVYTGYIDPFRWRVGWSDAKTALPYIGDYVSRIHTAATDFNSHVVLRENMLPISSHMHDSALKGLDIKFMFLVIPGEVVSIVAYRVWKDGVDITGIVDVSDNAGLLLGFSAMFSGGGSLTDAYLDFDVWTKIESGSPTFNWYPSVYEKFGSQFSLDQFYLFTSIHTADVDAKNLQATTWEITPSIQTGLLLGASSIKMETANGWIYSTPSTALKNSSRVLLHRNTGNKITLDYGREEVNLVVTDKSLYSADWYIPEVRYVPVANSTYQTTQSLTGQTREYGTWNPLGSTVFVRDAHSRKYVLHRNYWHPEAFSGAPIELYSYPPFITITKI